MDKSKYRKRLIDSKVDFYLSTFGAVCIEGPKWCGKTWTSTMHAKSAFMLADPADNFANRELAKMDVSKALVGESPHLIDEWQEVASIWDAVRYSVDQSTESGRYILTGSSTPLTKGVVHSGTGRIASLAMHPMSLFEMGESSGVVSISDVCAGRDIGVQTTKSPSLEELVAFVVCGGWPGSLGKSQRQAAAIPREYVENVIRIDMQKLDGIERDQAKVRKCLRSLARNESTTAVLATIRDDIEELDAASLSVNTVAGYLDAFKRIYLTNDIEPFSTFLRMLLRDLRTFGFLFESLAIRDLQIYAESIDARLFYYQDYEGREIDAVIQFEDGAWSAFEVKLNPGDVDDAAANLKRIASVFRHNPPSSLAVVVGKSGIAHRRDDGVYVLPITTLRP